LNHRFIATVLFPLGGVVARGRNSGVLGAWAEAQRRQQRLHEAQQRAWRAEQLQQERAQRAAIRAQARDQREALRAYQYGREMDAAARTGELSTQVTALAGILLSVLATRPFQLEQLMQEVTIPPFAPGRLAVPVAMPDQSSYQVQPPSRLRALSSAARREHQEACQRAQAQFERDYQIAMDAERRRQHQLADYYRQYQEWAERERQRIIDHNGQVRLIGQQMASGDRSAACEYFGAALYASAGWPEGFPRRARASWDNADHHLVVDWELPDSSVVPAISRYRYIKSDDRETQIPRLAGERKSIYRNTLAQSALAVLAEIFRADHGRLVGTATVNGFVSIDDPATGRRSRVFLLTVTVERAAFTRLDLSRVDPVSCLEGLRGQLSPRPENLAPVHPVQLTTATVNEPLDDAGTGLSDLLTMDPIDFEELVAALFKAMGMEVMTTQRSGDGGVDVRAMDPDPIRGGKLVIQVKRYHSTIPPAPVRDLYGTMLHEGATKGILVTTAEFGPSAQEFANGKPLTLIGGKQLVDLFAQYGIGQ
jgi:restriction system protein